ncbi:MAG: NAD-dependent epimerase/dehydratase family protein [Acidocella sp.]|nr:NAD-dependent epimerase/dehydratase family protein [Acidocella sp.]
MSPKRVVAVTGATGFLGLHLIPALARAGAHVRILARRDPTHPAWQGVDFETVRGSLEDKQALARLVSGADAVVHAAGLIKARNRTAFLHINAGGTAAVAQATRQNAPQARFIAISSLAAREPQISDYAFSKREGENAAHAAYTDAPAQLVIIRPPAIYGPWDRETLEAFKAASRPIAPIIGQGRIAVVHVTDAAAAIAALAMGAGEAGLYALADTRPEGYSMVEFLSEAGRAVGNTPRFIRMPDGIILAAGAISGWWGRVRGQAPIFTKGKARELLHPDWSVTQAELLPAAIHRPEISLSEGFAATAAWYRRAGWLG